MTAPTTAVPAKTGSAQQDTLAIRTLRLLAADAVEAASSGHPGLPMGMAPAAWVLWSRTLRFDPAEPDWPDRDRFVLSAGHGSALLYGLLHLCGFDLPLDELRRFRQIDSRTPGHPEHGLTPGVEMTTGPLGQGIATASSEPLTKRRPSGISARQVTWLEWCLKVQRTAPSLTTARSCSPPTAT